MRLAPLNKEPGVALVSEADLRAVHSSILDQPCYSKTCDGSESAIPKFRKGFHAMCSQVAKSELGELDSDLYGLLIRPMHLSPTRYASVLKTLCKSHKPPGHITWRNLHCSRLASTMGLSKWLVTRLDPVMTGCAHLLQSVQDFVKDVRSFRLEDGYVFAKFDVREFFMSGRPDELIAAMETAVPRDGSFDLALTVARWLLENQYVYSSELAGVWRVTRGSGMGLGHSSSVADLAFLGKVDRMLCQLGFKRARKIAAYWRFKDDLLFAIHRDEVGRLSRLLSLRAAPLFTIVQDGSGSRSVDFLSVHVVANDRGIVCTSPVLKNGGAPLSVSSAHPSAIHLKWPRGYLNSLCYQCSSLETYKKVVGEFVKRFTDYFESPERVAGIVDGAFSHSKRSEPVGVSDPRRRPWWFVLPYHSLWENSAVGGMILRFCDCPLMREAWREAWHDLPGAEPPCVRVAWKVTDRRLMTVLDSKLRTSIDVETLW